MARHRKRYGLRWQPLELAEPEPAPKQVDPDSLVADVAVALGTATPELAVAQVLQRAAGVSAQAVKALLELYGPLFSSPSPVAVPSPVRNQRRHELVRRAAYLLSAGRRLSQGVRDGTLGSAVETERTYLKAHRQAVDHRMDAARQVAGVAQTYPDSVGWYAVKDDRTSAECRAAHGRNFNPAQMPAIGYPGAVHPACRCKPGPPHANSEWLEGSGPARTVQVDPQFAAALSRGREQAMRQIDLVKSSAYPDLERKPGKQNWVDKVGGLPSYIERIAKHLHYEKGMDISRAIATAVSTVKRWAAGGGDVTPETRAKAAAAVAAWETKKAASHAD